VEVKRERSDTLLWEPNHLIYEDRKKEKREIYCLLSCRAYPVRYCTAERKEEGVLVILSFLPFPSNNT